MTIHSRIMIIQNAAKRLPESPQKTVLLNELEEMLFFIDKHDDGDKAVSDEFHKMCNECQKLLIENRMLKLELERLQNG